MAYYKMKVKTFDESGMLIQAWGSEIFEASTELDALKDAVESLAEEFEDDHGLTGICVAGSTVSEELMTGCVKWKSHGFNYRDIVTMEEYEEDYSGMSIPEGE